MPFHRTVNSLFQSVKEIPIVREQQLASLLVAYEQQTEQQTTLPDRGLIEQASTLLQERLATMPLDFELLQLAFWINNEKGAFDESVALMRRFLAEPHLIDEQAYAHWHLVDNLALARRCEETVQEQKKLLHFVRQHYPPEHCLFVMSDGTQAACWEQTGHGDEWIMTAERLLDHIVPGAENRSDRFYVLRTMAYVCISSHEIVKAHHAAQSLRALAEEDPLWFENRRYLVEAALIQVKTYHEEANVEGIRLMGQELTHLLDAWEPEVQGLALAEEKVRQYRMLCHNVAAPLYRARQYDLAIPLFQRAITYGAMPYEPYLWLAASIWATTKKRDVIYPLLTQAAQRYNDGEEPWQKFRTLPEFQDVQYDPQFERASQVVSFTSQ